MSTVILSEHQLEWPTQFREAAFEIEAAFRGLAVHVEHIGSTSVSGLCAKPVIDILLGAQSLTHIESRVASLVDLGYQYRPESEAELPERRYFVRQESVLPRIHLHAVAHGGPFWRRQIAFRDALRNDSSLALRYASLKRELAVIHSRDKAAYTEAKGPFIKQVLEETERQ